MPALGKEIERRQDIDDIALQEVDGYIDRVEKQVEAKSDNTQRVYSSVVTIQQPTSQKEVDSQQKIVATRPDIRLPLDRSGVEDGLTKGVVEGVRWLAEWCVMMIKKYPGRVFYTPPIDGK